MKRQPKGFMPNAHSPTAISHLPIGGCTTYECSGVSWICGGCISSASLAFFAQVPS